MIARYLSRLIKSNLSIRLLVLIIASVLIIALMASGVQLYFEYHKDVKAMYDKFDFIESSYVPAITASSYLVDNKQLMIQLKGVLQIQGIEFLRVTEERGSEPFQLQVGNPEISYPISKVYKLQYQKTADQKFYVGILLVKASLAQTYHRLKERAGIILLTNGTGLILVAFCILLIFEFAVTRHLVKMADFTNELDIDELNQRLALDRRSGKLLRPDEMDNMARTINDLRIRLKEDITRRKQSEEALRKSEENYRSLIHRIQAAVVVHDADTKIIASNPKAQELLGLTEDQMLGKTAIDPDWKFLRADGVRLAHKEYPVNQVMITREPQSDLTAGVYRPSKGDIVWTLVHADPVFDDNGQIQQVIVTFVDISEHKQAEEALRNAEEQNRLLLEQVHGIVWTVDKNLRFTSSRGAGLANIGLKPDQVVGQSLQEFLGSETAQAITAVKQAFIGKSVQYEEDFGGTVWESRVEPLRDHSDQVVGSIAISLDITERKQAEDAINAFFDQSLVMLFIADLQTNKIVRINNEVIRTTKRTEEEIISAPFIEFIHPEDRESTMEVMARLADGKPLVGYHNRHLTAEGEIRVFEWNGVPDMERKLVYAMAQDITERKRTDEELIRYQDHLEEMVKERTSQLEQEIDERKKAEKQIAASLAEKEVLLREIHHRVKNNLNTVSNLLYLQSRTIENERITAAFRESRNRIQTMARVHELLYRSQTLARIDMNAYLKELTADLAEAFPHRSALLATNACGVRLEIERAIPCGLIATELVTNALKYAFATDTPRKRIRVELSAQGDDCRLVVADNGVGLPEGFNIEQARSLGLRLVEMLTRQLHGSLDINSAPGQGTRFCVAFETNDSMEEA